MYFSQPASGLRSHSSGTDHLSGGLERHAVWLTNSTCHLHASQAQLQLHSLTHSSRASGGQSTKWRKTAKRPKISRKLAKTDQPAAYGEIKAACSLPRPTRPQASMQLLCNVMQYPLHVRTYMYDPVNEILEETTISSIVTNLNVTYA